MLLFLFLSCNKNKKQYLSNLKDSIKYYSKNDNLSLKENDNFFNILKNSDNSSKNRQLISNVAFNYYNLEKLEKFKLASYFLLKSSESKKDTLFLAKSYRFLGGFYKYSNNNDSSFYYYIKAEKIYLKLDKKDDYANILLHKSIIQNKINDFLGADYSLNKAFVIFKKNNDSNKIYETLNQLGLVSNELKDYRKADEYLTKALKTVIENKIDNDNQKATCLNNLGFVSLNSKNYKKANNYFELGLNERNVSKNSPDLYSNLLDNLAFSKLQSNDLKDLPKLFFKALEIRQAIGNSTNIVLSNIHLSEYYNKIKEYEKSLEFTKIALKVARENNNPSDIVEALKQAAAVDKLNASKYTNEYIHINDSLLTAERKNLDRFARIQLETDEVIKENKVLDTKNQNLVYYLFGTVVIFSLSFLVYNQKQKQKIFVLKQEQQATNQQIFDLLINQQEAIAQSRISEKKRMAKELHDGVLGRLFGTRLFLDGINGASTDDAISSRHGAIQELQSIEQQIREISHDLNSEKGKIINNFVGIVLDLIENQKKLHKSQLKFSIADSIHWNRIDNFAKINLYRILQETLQNANKYANATEIEVSFTEKDKIICLKITDNGAGFDVKKAKKGIGIANMKERAEESLGEYLIESVKTKGSTTTVTIPANKTKTTTLS